jgi:hypothetical protein
VRCCIVAPQPVLSAQRFIAGMDCLLPMKDALAAFAAHRLPSPDPLLTAGAAVIAQRF